MKRREFFCLSIAAAVCSYVGVTGLYGYMDVACWHRLGFFGRRRVLCDGVDITNDCMWFDDRSGEAQVLWRNGDGRGVVGPGGEPVVAHKRGRIRVV